MEMEMDDSDETICDDAEDPIISSQSQMSPSIITPIPRLDDVHQKTFTESESTITGHGSPEYLPPSAKMQKLADKEKQSLTEGCTESRVCHELQSSQATTANMEKTAEEKLTLIREQEEKIGELMVLLESNVKKGVAPRENPIFVQVKHLMTTVKTQLTDFTRYQQQQRQEIARCSNRAQGSEDSSSSQWTSETKHKLLELATQQKELLKLFQCHKKLIEKLQALKQKAKSVSKHVIPAVELHCNSNRGVNAQQKIVEQSTRPSLPMTSTASNMNPSAVTTSAKTIPESGSKQGDEQFVSKHTSISLMNVPSTYTQKPFSSPSADTSAVSQVTTLVDHPTLISRTPVTMSHNISSVTQTSVTPTVNYQPRVQNVVLTGGQLCQVGDRQVYVLPQGPATSVTSFAVAQATQPHQVTAAKLLSNKTFTTSVTNTTAVTQEMSLISSSSVAKSTQVPTLNTIITIPSTKSSWQDQITQTTSQLSISNTPVTSSCLTLPISATVSLSNSSLPVSTARSVSNSSALQHTPLPTGSETANHRSKQTTDANHSDLISRTRENTITITHLPKSTRIQPQHTTPSRNTAGVQSSLQAARMTAATPASKGPAVQSKSGQSLQRRNSFGSDLPDLKTLLGHNIIEAGSNVLSMQFEGRSFEASLRPTGLIESAGGETFRTPMAWMRAVTGSWNTVKQSHAYKMVHYKGRPLALFTIPSTENYDSCENRGEQNVSTAMNTAQDTAGSNKQPCSCGHSKTSKEGGLITCWEDVAKLLTDCKVIPIGKDELVPTDSFLPANFWDSTSEVDIPQSLLEELDF
ncbi:hypothetical protein ACROYT_G010433 [Oculina patagonica]